MIKQYGRSISCTATIGLFDTARQAAPDFAMAHLRRAWMFTVANDPGLRTQAEALVETAQSLPLNEREQPHLAALSHLCHGARAAAVTVLDRHLMRYPFDLTYPRDGLPEPACSAGSCLGLESGCAGERAGSYRRLANVGAEHRRPLSEADFLENVASPVGRVASASPTIANIPVRAQPRKGHAYGDGRGNRGTRPGLSRHPQDGAAKG
jgi:hypothetical protein